MLVERADHLVRIAGALSAALAGHGRLVFLGGEAGVGKSSVVAAATSVLPAEVQVRRGFMDNVTTAGALGAVLEAMPELSTVLDDDANVDRRALFRHFREVVSVAPTVLVLEDVHWADEATLDLLRYVGRRLDGLQLLVLATFRSEEVSARHPLAEVLGELATAAGVQRLDLAPLSVPAVTELVAEVGSTLDPERLHERTGGNAFYVTEILAGPTDELPPTVRDAVLARAARLSDAAGAVLAAAAVVGQPADPPLLTEVADGRVEDVDECVDAGLLVRLRDGWAFRHELAREAIEQSLGPGRATILHARALAALLARGSDDDRRLAHHAALAGDRATAFRHAHRCAARSARLGAHREAAAQYRLALRCHDGDATTREQLLAALSYECYLTDELADALTARLKAMELAELRADRAATGQHERWASRLSWFLGRNADSERYARRAIESLEAGGDGHELAMAYSNKAQLRMLASDVPGAEHWAGLALSVARRIGDRDAETHALNNLGTAQLMSGDSPEARTLLTRSLELALVEDAHEHAARAYTNLGGAALVNRRLDDADDALRAGIAYCADRDLDSWRLYMSAQLADSLTEQGRYDEAAGLAAEVLRQPRLPAITTIVASVAAAQIALRRGSNADELLATAWELAAGTGEGQRLVPVAVALAERDWLEGTDRARVALDTAWAAALQRPVPWEIGELAWWRMQFGLPAQTEQRVATPFALLLAGDWAGAATGWASIGAPLWQALALAREESVGAAADALAIIDRLDAPAVRDAVVRERRAAGLPLPRGPRAASRANPAGLTGRELEVLHLLADGSSNADIAAELFLSDKTVGHHVSAILRKLDEPTRARAVAAANRRGLLLVADPPVGTAT